MGKKPFQCKHKNWRDVELRWNNMRATLQRTQSPETIITKTKKIKVSKSRWTITICVSHIDHREYCMLMNIRIAFKCSLVANPHSRYESLAYKNREEERDTDEENEANIWQR